MEFEKENDEGKTAGCVSCMMMTMPLRFLVRLLNEKHYIPSKAKITCNLPFHITWKEVSLYNITQHTVEPPPDVYITFPFSSPNK